MSPKTIILILFFLLTLPHKSSAAETKEEDFKALYKIASQQYALYTNLKKRVEALKQKTGFTPNSKPHEKSYEAQLESLWKKIEYTKKRAAETKVLLSLQENLQKQQKNAQTFKTTLSDYNKKLTYYKNRFTSETFKDPDLCYADDLRPGVLRFADQVVFYYEQRN